MVDAYEQESKYAVLPRIIISEKIASEYIKEIPNALFNKTISVDCFDFNYIVDYMKFIFVVYIDNINNETNRNQLMKDINCVRKIIEVGICNKDKHVRQKYVYLLEMFNKYCILYQEKLGDLCKPIDKDIMKSPAIK